MDACYLSRRQLDMLCIGTLFEKLSRIRSAPGKTLRILALRLGLLLLTEEHSAVPRCARDKVES